MKIELSKIRILILVILMIMVCSFSAQAAVKGSFVYNLSRFHRDHSLWLVKGCCGQGEK